ncbi:MAG: methyltransferase domain-containing protein [Pseudonocardiaceae bacterium]|nr:methyltransferase domain-containing protein [Pseudonocardiaceae bacterium]
MARRRCVPTTGRCTSSGAEAGPRRGGVRVRWAAGGAVTGYVFDASDLVGEQRKYMQQALDPITTARMEALGVGPGWRCLEVGGGGGSIADWLSERAGNSGHVLVTDVDPDEIRRNAENISIRRHDIVSDELPEAEFDLVHARLVLLHLPERHRALTRMVRALRPGGWLLLGEFDCTWMPVLSAPNEDTTRLFRRFHAGLCQLLTRAGADIAWGTHAYQALRGQGLAEVGHCAQAHPWPGGSVGCRWLHVNSLQLQDKLIAAGLLTAAELDTLRDLLADPRFVVSSYLTTSTWGRRTIEP